jgi:hypothetical protein
MQAGRSEKGGDRMTDDLCLCGHPESKHDDHGMFGRGRCNHKWWVDNTDDCYCERFVPATEDTSAE